VNDDERVPIDDAVRSLDWMMAQLTAARRERDISADLFRRLDAAMSEYVATTRALLERNPYADATAKREARSVERIARARAYRVAGLSVPGIGLRMGREDGRGVKYGEDGVAYSESTVRRWLKPKKGRRTP
jgi:hypothetical protein